MPGPAPLIAISWGELLDRCTILELKVAHLPPGPARDGQRSELASLVALSSHLGQPGITENRNSLRSVNARLREVEDALRNREKRSDFGAEFIALARSVCRLNDQRAALKRAINALAGSAHGEVKLYRT